MCTCDKGNGKRQLTTEMLTLINFEKWKSKNKNADFYKISFLKEEAELRAVYF